MWTREAKCQGIVSKRGQVTRHSEQEWPSYSQGIVNKSGQVTVHSEQEWLSGHSGQKDQRVARFKDIVDKSGQVQGNNEQEWQKSGQVTRIVKSTEPLPIRAI